MNPSNTRRLKNAERVEDFFFIEARYLDVLSFPGCTIGVGRQAARAAGIEDAAPLMNGSGNSRRGDQRLQEAALNHRILGIAANGFARCDGELKAIRSDADFRRLAAMPIFTTFLPRGAEAPALLVNCFFGRHREDRQNARARAMLALVAA